LIDDEYQAADDLANFILELRRINPQDGPPAGRRPLSKLDKLTRNAIQAAAGVIDTAGVTAAWELVLEAPVWDGQPVWIHADLLRSNLLVRDGRLCAVIDFGGSGVGDPAFDVVPAWSVFQQNGRDTFRKSLDVDEGIWARGRGYALHQALLIIPYYAKTNPQFVRQAKRTVDQVLSDLEMAGNLCEGFRNR
jgi:aminoglycoside phosphotransferase (APT) family kinase protein